jgi:hypothetical protein
MVESTKIQSFTPRAEWVELESGEFVSRRLYNLRVALALHTGLRSRLVRPWAEDFVNF